MSDKQAIRHLHALLKHRDKWYIDVQCPEVDEWLDLCERAKESADTRLSELSFNALYLRYEKWRKSDPITDPNGYLFGDFLNDTVWELGKAPLKGSERDIYEQNCYLSIKFI